MHYRTFQKLEEFLKTKDNPAAACADSVLHRASYQGRVCGLTWQDINLEEQYLTVRRSMRYNRRAHNRSGTTKRSKVRTVDFCDTLAAILRAARTEQRKNRSATGSFIT